MQIRIVRKDASGEVRPLDDCDWETIQLASFFHGRKDVTREEVNEALAETRREKRRHRY